MLYTLNLSSAICQLNLNKTENTKLNSTLKLTNIFCLKKRKRGRMKINYSNYLYAMHSGSDFSKFPTILTMPGSHHQCE